VIRLDVFEGPLDLLLYLIEREELDITAVAVAQVTTQYLEYLAGADHVAPALMADFVAMAARLLQIKSRALLPRPARGEEEDEEEDPAEALARQLREYKQFREIANLLSERDAAHLHAYVRVAAPPALERHLNAGDASLSDLLAAVKRVLEQKEAEGVVATTVVTPHVVTIDEKITRMRHLLKRRRRVAFEDLLREAHDRQEVIVSFLAILELVKQHEVGVFQSSLFGPITVEALAPSDDVPENGSAPAATPVESV